MRGRADRWPGTAVGAPADSEGPKIVYIFNIFV